MCRDCFEYEYYKFNSSAEFDKFNAIFDSKISKTILFVGPNKYKTDLHNVYKCKSCEEIWWLSDPDNHWRGYFLKKKNAQKFIDEDERKGNLIKYGCLIVFVFLISLATLLLFLSCTDKTKNLTTPETKSDIAKSDQKEKEEKPVIDTILNEGSVIIYGDTTIEKDKIREVLIKFEPYITFDDFKVSIENVKAKLDLNSHKLGMQFRTAIRESYNNPENLFAGHYTFATWGCGSPCQMNVLIDRRTGKIYDAPDSSVGSEFKKDSRMLIINPPEEENYFYNNCLYCKPEIYILNEITKKFEKKEPYKK